jgi:hypothetical protein
MPDKKNKKQNNKKVNKKGEELSLPYEAVRAYNATGDETDPLGSWTGTARTGEAGPASIDSDNGHKSGDVSQSGILLPPREKAPRGGDMLPGMNGLPGGPFPVGEPVQHGVPGGKTYYNVKEPDQEVPTQDADDL